MNKFKLNKISASMMLGLSCLGVLSSVFGIIYDGVLLKGGLYAYLDNICIFWLAASFGHMALFSLYPERAIQWERCISQNYFQIFLLAAGMLGVFGCGYLLFWQDTPSVFYVVFMMCIYLFFAVHATRRLLVKGAS